MKRLSRPDPVSNRNTIIMGNFAKSKLSSTAGIFSGLDYPQNVLGRNFKNSEDFYLWEHGWHTLPHYITAYRRLRDILGPSTYFDCGATVAKYHSWGLFEDMKYMFNGVIGAMEKASEINTLYNDVKDIIIAEQPIFNPKMKKITAKFIVRFHDDQDPNTDYPSDPHILGIFSQAPVVWGLRPAKVTQPMVPYDLERLCQEEPDFSRLDLNPKVSGDTLFIRDPITQKKRALAQRVVLIPEEHEGHEYLCGTPVFLGKHRSLDENLRSDYVAFLLDGALQSKDHVFFAAGTIIKAPYHVIDFTSDKEGNTLKSLFYGMQFKVKKERSTRKSLLEALRQITEENKEKVAAYEQLKNQYAHERKLERLMTGGFAHEVRNKLAPAQYETKQLENDNVIVGMRSDLTAIMRSLVDLEQKYAVPRSYIASEFVPRMRTLATYTNRMETLFKNVANDVGLALRVTDQIRNYAKMQELQRGTESVDVGDLVQSYGKRYAAKLAENGITYQVTASGDSRITADPNHIDSILENLVKNAFEAVEHCQEKQVQVTLSNIEKKGNKYLRVMVSDSGEGIAPDHLPNIFYPFYSTKPDIGTGLGLSIANKLAELYQGSIDAASTPGKTTFTVDLWMS